ncbi:MAG: tetratricopeptide repeat protein [Cyanobacteria bacterium RYN_339]|nr:tetratricopeptide repeat protein [Cyanobacteria bacterium RYN_339]
MIRIRYVPPAGVPTSTEPALDQSSWRPDAAAFNPYELEALRLNQGSRSRLALDAVGRQGRRRRNQRDVLQLSKEWRELASKAGGSAGVWQTLIDATTQLAADGQPNVNALRQAQRQLRQWFFQQAQQGPTAEQVQVQTGRVDALLERLLRRNLDMGLGFAGNKGGAVPTKPESLFGAAIDQLRGSTNSAASLHRKGMKLWEENQPAAALDALEAAADKDPKSAKIKLDLGRMLADEGHYAQAEWTLLEADELAPKKAGPQVALGELYLEMGQPQLAIEAFKKAIARNPQHTDAEAQLGVAYYEQGEIEQATPHLQKAVQLDPQCVVARFYLAQVSLQENDLLRARFQLGMVAQLSPDMDLERFTQNQSALAAQASRNPKTAPLHHWQVPVKSPTSALRKQGTGPLEPPGTGTLVERATNPG